MRKAKLYMDTVVDIQVVTQLSREESENKVHRAFDSFRKVEQACSRFTLDSELMKACKIVGKPVEITPFLFEPLKFALKLATWTEGSFDPTIGQVMENHGFNRHYLTGKLMENASATSASYKDIVLDEQARTIFLHKPLIIDLGAVAKGFAIDLAVKELEDFKGFLVNAGGDLYAGGLDEIEAPWQIGVQHPYLEDEILETMDISNQAVCTSGSYERKNNAGTHHLIDPKTGQSTNKWISCTVIAPYTMMADAFSTASFIMDRINGQKLLEDAGIKGILITPELKMVNVGGI